MENNSNNSENKKNVVIYSADYCGYCRQAKEWMSHNNIDFTEKDVQNDESAREEFFTKMGGPSGIPVIDIDGEVIVGFDRARLSEIFGIKRF